MIPTAAPCPVACQADRTLAMARTGRFVASRKPTAIELVDALGTAPRRTLTGTIDDFAFVANELWLLRAGQITRHALASADATTLAVSGAAHSLIAGGGDGSATALVGSQLVDGTVGRAFDVPAGDAMFPLGGRHVLVARTALMLADAGRGERVIAPWPAREPIVAATYLFGTRAIAIVVGGERPRVLVLAPSGGRIHEIELPSPALRVAFADRRGLALIATGARSLVVADLRYGRIQHAEAPVDVSEIVVDADARYAAFTAGDEVLHGAFGELVCSPQPSAPPRSESTDAALVPTPPLQSVPPAPVVPPLEVSDALPLSLGAPLEPLTASAGDAEPFASPRAHVDALLDIVTLRTARAIAEAWSSGLLSVPADDARPFEREVMAIVGRPGAPDELVRDLSRRLAEAEHEVSARVRATIAAGLALPLVELGRELGLSPIACEVLMIVLAPQLRGEIARLYGVLANDEHRAVVDRCLVESIIAGTDAPLRAQVADELAGEAPLIRFGAVRCAGPGLFAALGTDAVALDRIRGRDVVEVDGATLLRTATRSLDELHMPRTLVRDIVAALAAPRAPSDPVRLVLRGRRGAGRHTLVATLAAKVGCRVAAIDASRLGREPQRFAAHLALELVRARLRRAVPVVSNLEAIGTDDADVRDHIEQVLRAHPGPVVLRVAPETTTLPLAPGYLAFAIPALSEAERTAAWRASLARACVTAVDVERLAEKFRIGPGTIEQIVQEYVRAPQPGDITARLETLARQHLAARLSHVATQVTRLADWEQVALPDDLRDSLKELVGRIRHRKTVFEAWGYDAKMTTSRGVSALFYGPPGTGKSMVAGLIARELGLDMYRVDLARVVSKWIGETEKNLAEVFDAAEAGQAVILFDEADSLFAKRTEVRSSTDRYANLEVNYLLQRLDSFEGICILTTNLDGSIDPAFKRRMSLRLQFPFPDEETRVQLWAAHIPSQVPVAGDLDLADLARRFPLSGGYIRNSALRAAFLAAQEARPLAHEHLVRAVQLEYRELGKLSTTGTME